MFKKTHLLSLILTSLFITACSDEAQHQGASDGGGGIIGGSTIEQVELAINDAKALIADPRFRYYFSIAVRQYSHKQDRSFLLKIKDCQSEDLFCFNEQRQDYVQQLFAHHDNMGEMRLAWETNKELSGIERREMSEAHNKRGEELRLIDFKLIRTESQWAIENEDFSDYLQRIPLDLVEKTACSYGHNQEADASVTTLDKTARVCFSLQNLQRIPPASLGKHIVSLWVHELAHMEGYNEELAKHLESLALAAYDKYILNMVDMIKDYAEANGYMMELSHLLTVADEAFSMIEKDSNIQVDSLEVRTVYFHLAKALDFANKYIRISGPSPRSHEDRPFLTHFLYAKDNKHRQILEDTRQQIITIRDGLESTFKITESMEYPEDLPLSEASKQLAELYGNIAMTYFNFVEAALTNLCGRDLSLVGDNPDHLWQFYCKHYDK